MVRIIIKSVNLRVMLRTDGICTVLVSELSTSVINSSLGVGVGLICLLENVGIVFESDSLDIFAFQTLQFLVESSQFSLTILTELGQRVFVENQMNSLACDRKGAFLEDFVFCVESSVFSPDFLDIEAVHDNSDSGFSLICDELHGIKAGLQDVFFEEVVSPSCEVDGVIDSIVDVKAVVNSSEGLGVLNLVEDIFDSSKREG